MAKRSKASPKLSAEISGKPSAKAESKAIPSKPLTILYAEDDPDDCMLFEYALEQLEINAQIHFVENGEKLLDCLFHRKGFEDPSRSPRPDIIIVDLKMPKINGHAAIKAIKSNEVLRSIPVIVLSTSDNPLDVERSYALGAVCHIAKDSILTCPSKLKNALKRALEQLPDPISAPSL